MLGLDEARRQDPIRIFRQRRIWQNGWRRDAPNLSLSEISDSDPPLLQTAADWQGEHAPYLRSLTWNRRQRHLPGT